MKDEKKTKSELIRELWKLRRKVSRLEKLELQLDMVRDELKTAEDEKALILDSISELMSFQDPDLRVIWASRGVVEALGKPPDDLKGMHCCEVWHNRSEPCEDCQAVKAMETGRPQKIECTYPDGRSWLTRCYPVLGEDGEIEGTVKATLELTALKRAEKALKESEARMMAVFEAAKDIAFITTEPHGNNATILDFSPGAERIFGYARDEIIGKTVSILHPRMDEKVAEIEDARKMKAGFKGEATLVRRSGEQFPAIFSIYPIQDAEGNTSAYLNAAVDITGRKRAEQELRELMEKYKTLLRTSPDSVVASDLKGCITELSDRALEIYGCDSPDELIGRNSLELLVPEDRQRAMMNLKKTLEEGVIENAEYTFYRKDGSTYIGEMNASLIRDSQGNPKGFIASGRDITERKKAEQELIREKNFSESIINSLPGSFYIFDENGKYIRWNEYAEKITGYSGEEISRMSPLDFILEEDREKVAESIKEVFIKGEGRVEAIHVTKSGKRIPSYFHGKRIEIDNRYYIVGMGIDITERKNTENELKKYREHLEQLVDEQTSEIKSVNERLKKDIAERRRVEVELRIMKNAIDASLNAIAISDLEGKITYVNPAFVRMWGYEQTEAVGIMADEFWQDRQRALEAIAVLREKGQWEGELTAKRKDGITFPVLLSANTVINESGIPICMMVSGIDITEHKNAQKAIRESEQKLAGIINAVADSVAMVDRNNNVVWANDVAKKMFGPYMVGRKCYEVFHSRQKPCEICLVRKTLKDGKVHQQMAEATGKDGQELYYWQIASVAAYDDDGRPKMVVEASRNITEQKRAVEALTESEARYRLLADNVTDIIWTTDKNLRYTYISPSVQTLTGYTPEEFMNLKMEDTMTPESLELARRTIAEEIALERSGKGDPDRTRTLQMERICKDGSHVWIESIIKILHDRDGKTIGLMGVSRNITERKRAEEALRESEYRYRSLFESFPEPILLIGLDGNVLDCNHATGRITGMTREEFIGSHISSLINLVNDDDKRKYNTLFSRLAAGEDIGSLELNVIRSDGKTRWVRMFSAVLKKDDKPYALQAIIREIESEMHSAL